MPMVPLTYSISTLAIEFDLDRRTVAKRIGNIMPVEIEGRTRKYLMKDVASRLAEFSEAQSEPGTLSKESEQTRLFKEQADKLEFENAVKRGELLPLEETQDAILLVFTNIKARLLAIPTRAAAVVFGMESMAEIAEEIKKLIYEAMTDLAKVRLVDSELEGVDVNQEDD
jgi:phage terminase Nu1 subunit (DNA packaging protein)